MTMTRDDKILLTGNLAGCKVCLTTCAADVRRRQPQAALYAAEALVVHAKKTARELRAVLRRQERAEASR